jgi:DNA-binding CsgD family transcriptional regulator/PAS domain-containing protein
MDEATQGKARAIMSAELRAGDQLPDLLGNLYDGVLEPSRMSPAMEDLAGWLGMDCSHFIGWDTARFVPRMAVVTQDTTDHVSPEYVEYYSHIDPRRAKMMGVPMGEVLMCQQMFDDHYVSHNEFYQEFLIPRGRRYTMGAHLYRDAEMDFYVTFYHRVGRPPFSNEQRDRAQHVVPHLQRLTRLLRTTDGWRTAARQGEEALNALDQGVLLLDAQGEVLFSNQRAQSLLRAQDCLGLKKGRLCAISVAGQLLLGATMARVMQTGLPESLRLFATSAQADAPVPHCLTVTRLARDEHLPAHALHARAELLVLVSVPQAQRSVTAHQLMQLFTLTHAEARLAHALARGWSVDEYAKVQGLGLPTVRTQVRSVLDKTGAARQQDLVRMLALLPSARQSGRPGVGH